MTADLERFRTGYDAAFRSYLVGTGETGLESAYELGRQAVTGGLSLLELAGVHHEVLADCLGEASSPADAERISKAGTDFFLESLATFEMTQRGFQEAHETAQLQARHASQLRGLAEASLAVNSTLSSDEMLELVERSAREIIGTRRSMVTTKTEARTPGEGWLTIPLIDREGRRLGLIQVAEKLEGEFTENDKSILLQLAQMASAALENARHRGRSPAKPPARQAPRDPRRGDRRPLPGRRGRGGGRGGLVRGDPAAGRRGGGGDR